MTTTTWAVLRDRDAALYLTGVVISGFGTSALWLVSGVWVKDLTGSDGLAALCMLAMWTPTLAGPLLGALADRFPRKPLLVASSLFLAALLPALLAVDSPGLVWLLLAVLFVYGATGVVNDAAEAALVAGTLPPALLGHFNGLRMAITEGMKLISPLAGAGLYTLYGGPAVVLLDAATFVVAAGVYAGLRVRGERAAGEGWSGEAEAWRAEAGGAEGAGGAGGGQPGGAGQPESGRREVGRPGDAEHTESGWPKAGQAGDTGQVEAGRRETGRPGDAEHTESGWPKAGQAGDTGQPEPGQRETGQPRDAEHTESGWPKAGQAGDTGQPEPGQRETGQPRDAEHTESGWPKTGQTGDTGQAKARRPEAGRPGGTGRSEAARLADVGRAGAVGAGGRGRVRRIVVDALAGARHLWAHPRLRPLVLAGGVTMLCAGVNGALIYAVIDGLGHSPAFAGALYAVQGAGSVGIGLVSGRALRRFGERRFAAWGIAATAVAVGLRALPYDAVALGCSAVIGAGLPCVLIAVLTAVQRETPDAVLGRTVATANTLVYAPNVIGLAAGAALAELVDHRTVLVVLALAWPATALPLLRGGTDDRRAEPEPARHR